MFGLETARSRGLFYRAIFSHGWSSSGDIPLAAKYNDFLSPHSHSHESQRGMVNP
jgi:hypothetical protein